MLFVYCDRLLFGKINLNEEYLWVNKMEMLQEFDELTNCIQKVFKGNEAIIKKFDTWNAVDGTIIGTGESDYTKDFNTYTFQYKGKEVSLLDVPGIEGREQQFEEQIQRGVNKAHIVLYINGTEKKPEAKTVNKIKKYINTDTAVYAVCNIPCKAKKNRLRGSYELDLQKKYERAEDLLEQTYEMLQPVLGHNLKGKLCVNGMLAFCGLAYDKKRDNTTIIPDTDNKFLREEQNRYAKDLNYDYDKMLRLSKIDEITEIIETHLDDKFIVEANKKKLISKMENLITKLEEQHTTIKEQNEKLIDKLTFLENDLDTAHTNFEANVKNIPKRAACNVISFYKEKFYEVIEANKGKIKEEQLECVANANSSRIQKMLNDNIEKRFEDASNRLKDDYRNAQQQLQEDLRDLIKYQKMEAININSIDISSIVKELSYGFKDFFKDIKTIGEMAFSFGLAGSGVPGIGTIAGAIAGAITGLFLRIYDRLFLSEYERINKAKNKINDALDSVEDNLIKNIDESFKKQGTYVLAEAKHSEMHSFIQQQKDVLYKLDRTFEKIIKQLKEEKRSLGGLGYGKI